MNSHWLKPSAWTLSCALMMAAVPMRSAHAQDNGATDIQKVVPQGKLPGQLAPYFIRSGEGERWLVGGLVATLIARGEDTGEMFETAILTGGRDANFPPHTHARSHEALLVLEGEVEFWLGNGHYLMHRGDYASIPPGTPHALKMLSHRTQVLSWTTGKEVGPLYEALGQAYAGYVQPEKVDPAIAADLKKKAEATADVRFDAKPPAKGTPQRVQNATIPDKNVPYVLAAGEGQRMLAGDQLFTFLGDQKNSDGRFIAVMTEGPPGPMIPAHYHEKHTENFFCLDGIMTMRANGESLTVYPGDYVHVPARTIHAYQLNSPYTRFVGFLTPGLFESFFRTLGDKYDGYVYPQKPGPFRFDRVLAKLNELDLKLVESPAPKK